MHYTLKDLSIDVTARSVHRGKESLSLPDLSFDVLIKLIEAAPTPVNLSELSLAVWQMEHVSGETIAQRITLLRKALGDAPKEPIYIRTVRGLGYAIIGEVSQSDSKFVPAPHRSFFRKPLAIIGGVAVCVFLSIALFKTQNTPPEQAASLIEPDRDMKTESLVTRAQDQLRLHQFQETNRAIGMLREALSHEPDSFNARLTLSFALSTKATKFDGNKTEEHEAESIARNLISEQPDNSNAWSALGYSLSSQGRADEALAAYRQAYEFDPKNDSALSSAAHILLLQGDLQQALILEEKARQTGHNTKYAEIQIAQILELIGHPSAQNWREKALSLNPGQAVILGEVARSHLRQGEPQAALDILAQYEGEDQATPHILVLRARAAIALGFTEDARNYLEAAGWRGHYALAALNAASGDATLSDLYFSPSKRLELESDPDPEIRVHLAEISAALGRENEAAHLLSQAINLGWRDISWLKQSPFLQDLMLSQEGYELEKRIRRELDAQRRLIENTDTLAKLIRG